MKNIEISTNSIWIPKKSQFQKELCLLLLEETSQYPKKK